MKPILLFSIIFLFFLAGVQAQPVLHSADLNPVAGDKIIQATAKILNVKTPPAGTNKVWNYSKLKDSTTSPFDTSRYMKKNGTPFASLFPKATLAGTSSNNPGAYVYYKGTSAFLESFGSASVDDTATWVPPYRLAVFPATYGTNFTDTSTVTFKQGGTTFKEGYRDSSKVVGYGTLKLPGVRTFTNVLMVKTTTIITFKIGSQTYVTKSYSINFYVAGYHNPLISFALDQANKISFITYSKDATPSFNSGVADEEDAIAASGNAAGFKLYPNPASSGVTVNFNNANGKKIIAISINDLNGKSVYIQRGNIFSGERINCSSLKEGIYLMRIQMDDGSAEVQKLEIRK
jgi:Secretion system C-terminal sorting domain